MPADWNRRLDRWRAAGLLDDQAVQRILEFEGRSGRTRAFRWPVALALAFGALLIGAGVLLFVSAHWEALSPWQRVSLVVALVAVFHLSAALAASRFEPLSVALHTTGTLALGAGIALTGQIFNLAEHWPSAVLLWAAGAAFAWRLLGDWPQFALTALLVPWWIAGDWVVRYGRQTPQLISAFLLATAFTYLGALSGDRASPERRVLVVLGSLDLLPLAILACDTPHFSPPSSPPGPTWIAWTLAFLLPLALAVRLRGSTAWINVITTAWTAVLSLLARYGEDVAVYLWCALGAVGLVAWGLREGRTERVNLGVAGFALTVLFFYFSTLLDKLGRSASLIGLGVLFLAGGWALEKTRRKLLTQLRAGAP